MRFKFTIIVSLLLILFGVTNVSASDKQVNLYYFHAEGCPTCALETTYLEELTSKDTNLVLHKYEIAFDKENQKLSKDVGELLNQPINSTPTLIIGREVIVGFKEGSTEKNETKKESASVEDEDEAIIDELSGNSSDDEESVRDVEVETTGDAEIDELLAEIE